MRTAQDIIIKPIITEESMMGIMTKKYTFKVAKDANKIEIAKAVESVFPGTKVAKVNTMNEEARSVVRVCTKATLHLGRKQSLLLQKIQRKLNSSTI